MKKVKPVEESDVAGVDFVLVLDWGDQPGHRGGHQVQGGVHLFGLLHKFVHELFELEFSLKKFVS